MTRLATVFGYCRFFPLSSPQAAFPRLAVLMLALALAPLGCGTGTAECGDAKCEGNESSANCPEDCGALCSDVDGDVACDANDNCPQKANADQADSDMDGIGDICDVCPSDSENDADDDGICGDVDNCNTVYNANQADEDADNIGNACDPCPQIFGGDPDQDGLCDSQDNCPEDKNESQEDGDGDGMGDVCDPCINDNPNDTDGDGVCDSVDICLGGDDNLDADGDGVADDCAECSYVEQKRTTVTFTDIYEYHGQGPFTFQVSLYENGDVQFQYDSVHNIAEAVVGIEAPLDQLAQQWEFETINVPNKAQLLFKNTGGEFDILTSRAADGPPFEWIDTEGGTPIELGDDKSTTIELPFPFPFQGREYRTINVASNGYLWFGGTWGDADSHGNCCEWEVSDLPTEHNWEMFIAPLWLDLSPDRSGSIRVMSDTDTCEKDCTDTWDGYAREDDCGTCTGGTTGVERNHEKDCEGLCFGEAYLDTCGTCSGGTTDHVANSQDLGCGCFEPEPLIWWPDTDSDGLGFGTAADTVNTCRLEAPLGYVDNNDDLEPDCPTNDTAECGVCGGLDCNNECGGGAFVDPCNICAGGNTGRQPASDRDNNNDGIPDACTGPDLVVDVPYMRNTLEIDYIYVAPGDCYIEERCVGGSGLRKVLRFGTMVGNQGNGDMAIGVPGGDAWVYASCHDHYHYEDYAFYELLTAEGRQITTVGYKNGWCVMDLTDFRDSGNRCRRYTCQNQGISAGCADIYAASLDCQWIDVTTVLDGRYVVKVTTNPNNNLYELDHSNNTAEVMVELTGNSVTVVDEGLGGGNGSPGVDN